MHLITAENAAEYLRGKGWIDAGPVRVETLGGGVSNQVLRVTTEATSFVLKQSRPQLRTKAEWFSDVDRIWREQDVMEMLGGLHPFLSATAIPKVLFSDRKNFLYCMTSAPVDALVWKESLLAGDLDLGVAGNAGILLADIHFVTKCHPSLMETFRDHRVFVQLRVEPFYVRIQERWPDVADVVAKIIDEMLTRKDALCHGDFTPKNMLVRGNGITLVDFETAHYGDPSMDMGLFLTHLLLKAFRAAERRREVFGLTKEFWNNYRMMTGAWQARGIRHLGVCLLARIDGTSPVDYLDESQRDAVRRLAKTILLDNVTTWDDVEALFFSR